MLDASAAEALSVCPIQLELFSVVQVPGSDQSWIEAEFQVRHLARFEAAACELGPTPANAAGGARAAGWEPSDRRGTFAAA